MPSPSWLSKINCTNISFSLFSRFETGSQGTFGGRQHNRQELSAPETTMTDKPLPAPLHELRRLRKPVRSVNIEHRKKLSRLERIAVWITDRVGTMGFFLVIFAWTLVWLGWNTLAPAGIRFDPFPAFVLWLFLSNMIQIFLMPLIMVGQNLQGRHAEARAEADFDVNTKAEREIEAILLHLESQNELILKILHHLEGAAKQ
jgi:uncharacterized membrane protein